MNVLVIGATGYIGRPLYQKCKTLNCYTVGTCFSQNSEGLFLPYSIGESIEIIETFFGSSSEKKHAVICAGESNIAKCKGERSIAHEINVTNTIKLINQLKRHGYHILFCCTDNVYDGEKGSYREIDEIDPINEYGKMKAEVEKYLLKEVPNSCSLRISKVVGVENSDKDMFKDWMSKALRKEPILCIQNNYFTPVHIDDLVNCILEIMKNNLTGIYNIAGNSRYSRIGLCKKFLKALELEADIKEQPLNAFQFNDKRPLDTSMSNKKIMTDLGYRFHELEECFDDYRGLLNDW